jgi:hypothetical protein
MCAKWDSPEKTIEILDELEGLRFDDNAFWRLHHFRERGRHATIKSHRSHCAKVKSFRGCGNNSLVQQRLDAVLRCYKAWRGAGRPNFATLAENAYRKHPHPECSP